MCESFHIAVKSFIFCTFGFYCYQAYVYFALQFNEMILVFEFVYCLDIIIHDYHEASSLVIFWDIIDSYHSYFGCKYRSFVFLAFYYTTARREGQGGLKTRLLDLHIFAFA